MRSGMVVLGPPSHLLAGLVFNNSLIHSSFIQIVFSEHSLSVRPQGSEIRKSQALLPGSLQSGGGQ